MGKFRQQWYPVVFIIILIQAITWGNYDTHTGRFLTRDPIGYADGMNLYQYVLSSPLVFADNIGRQATKPDEEREEIKRKMEACTNSINKLKKDAASGTGAIGKFYQCAVKQGCLDTSKISCIYEPKGPAAVYNREGHNSILVNAAKGQINWYSMLHELVHASDCKRKFDGQDGQSCADQMIREARAYWRMRNTSAPNCNCEQACEDAWDSADDNCYYYEVEKPKMDAWRKELDEWLEKPYPKEQMPSPPSQATKEERDKWLNNTKDSWIKACKAECGKGPLTSRETPDQDCDKILSAPPAPPHNSNPNPGGNQPCMRCTTK